MSNGFIDVNIEIDDREFKKLIKNEDKIIAEYVLMVASDVWGNIKRFVPKDHGRLGTSFQLKKINDLHYKIVSGVEYAEAVDTGTGIYGPNKRRITPQTAKVLHFFIGTKEVFAKSTKGQKGANYTGRAIDETTKRLQEFLHTVLDKY